MDSSGDGCVTKVEFDAVMEKPDLLASLTEMGVDVVGLIDFATFVFNECEELSYNNLLHMVLKFRGAKTATVKDVMDMRKQLSMQHTRLMETSNMMAAAIAATVCKDEPQAEVEPEDEEVVEDEATTNA
mmetsp:Transcript_123250/g.217355  ORF Transcript_123250/g.217355 Transcript_123250/m.217355 type:complete len:129 (-) Transcript_123250:5-391(-)